MPDTTPLAKLAPQSSLRDASQSREEAPRKAVPTRKPTRKAFWMKQLHTWHWMSSAVSLIGLLLFAITGFTLNHAAEIEGQPVVVEGSGQLPASLLPLVAPDGKPDAKKPLPPAVAGWVAKTFKVKGGGKAAVLVMMRGPEHLDQHSARDAPGTSLRGRTKPGAPDRPEPVSPCSCCRRRRRRQREARGP